MKVPQAGSGVLEDLPELSEINVTPFVDVMLVLLIIFMVAAPLSTVDLPVDLPSSSATVQRKSDKPTFVSIKPGIGVAVGEQVVNRNDLIRTLDTADANRDRIIYVRADKLVHYGELMDVLEQLRSGGYGKVRLVALEQAPSSGGASR
jgi:biopolymer transport protein ExbD